MVTDDAAAERVTPARIGGLRWNAEGQGFAVERSETFEPA
jgi:hypothetical protein